MLIFRLPMYQGMTMINITMEAMKMTVTVTAIGMHKIIW